jgi:hypothetical protein
MTMKKIPRKTPEERAADEQLTREVQEIFARMRARFAAAEAREAATAQGSVAGRSVSWVASPTQLTA